MQPTWPDLPPELVREISSHLLHNAADFVRFHAVCKSWRSSHHHPTTTMDHLLFLPWLVAPSNKDDEYLKLRCVFSNTSYRSPPLPSTSKSNADDGQMMNWVASADGTGIRYFTASPDRTILHDPLAGGRRTRLPPFPCKEGVDAGRLGKNPSGGIVYGDGAVLVYNKHDNDYDDTTEFTAALLRPTAEEWTLVQKTLESPYPGEFCAAYHNGNILVTVKDDLWHVLATTPSSSAGANNDDQVLVPRLSWMPREHDGYYYQSSYVLQSRGELLWASVHIKMDYPDKTRDLVGALSMSVHTLEEVTKGPEKLRWVRKDVGSLADRILFLGWPNSFTVDASRLDVSGGFAYFLYHDDKGHCLLHERYGVFKYNLVNNTTEFIEWLPHGWDDEMCAWLVPQPTIAPVDRGTRSNNMIHVKRCYGPPFRVLVRNLSLGTKSSQLQHLFGKNGKVHSAEVICHNKTKTSQGIGLVTIATMHACLDDALAALDGLVLDGRSLKVILLNGRPRRRRRRHRAESSIGAP